MKWEGRTHTPQEQDPGAQEHELQEQEALPQPPIFAGRLMWLVCGLGLRAAWNVVLCVLCSLMSLSIAEKKEQQKPPSYTPPARRTCEAVVRCRLPCMDKAGCRDREGPT